MDLNANAFLIKDSVSNIKILPPSESQNVLEEIKQGLNARQKYISPKFFYDKRGSELFEKITQLVEYYPTQTEKKLIKDLYSLLNIDFRKFNIIELGSGDHTKINLFLQQIPVNIISTLTYYPVDISQSAIGNATNFLMSRYPNLSVSGVVADFIHQLPQLSFVGKNLFLFFGSTIGNLTPSEIKSFMEDISSIMQPGDYLLLGMDLFKDISVLENAYNDSEGITEAFNLNVLRVINRITRSSLSENDFKHRAFFNSKMSRIEMHLEASKDMCIDFPEFDQKINFKKGETIHTENSHKFNKESIKVIGDFGNLHLKNIFMDDKKWFSLALYCR